MSLSPPNPHSLDAERSLPDATGATSLLPVPAGALAPDFGGGELAEAAPSGKTARQWQEAERRHRLVLLFRSLQADGQSGREAAEAVRAVDAHSSHPTLSRWDRAFAARGFAGLFDSRELAGRPRKHQLHEKETRALKAAYLATNRTADSGSVAEAVRLAHRRGELRPELAADFLERDRTGRMVPRALAAEITAAPAVVRQHRNPTDAALDFLNAPGASMWLTDERTGEERPVRVGDILEADDATVNFPVCVPWELGGDPCSERWGVRVARFQWLVAIDRASRFVPGWSYTARPRSSYRAEDLLSLFHGLFREHGVWLRVCLERGSWEAHKVSAMLEQLRIARMTAWSPHQKTYIEGLFNLLWTKLSDVPGQVGRFQGEEEETNRILTSCQRGATDPRLHFPLLGTALDAFRRATAERNAQAVKSPQFGTWVPEERWLAQQAEARERGRLRPLATEAAWLFAPEMRKWTVAGNTVGGSVQVMEGLSLRFDFAAEWLVEFAGAEVRVHFDPAAPRCEATVVLAQNVRDHRAGEVLGTAVQVNKTARYARKVLGWGDDADLGLQMRQQAATALRREVRTIRAGGGTGLSVTEARDGLGNSLTVERGAAIPEQGAGSAEREAAVARPVRGREPAVTAPRRGTNPFASATEVEFEEQRRRLARRRTTAAKLEELMTP
jgi:hypothetical protein